MIGKQREAAGWRVLAAIWQIPGAVLVGIVTTIALIWMVIDIIWSLLTNRNDLSDESKPAQYVSMTMQWSAGQLTFAFTGGGDGCWYWRPMGSEHQM